MNALFALLFLIVSSSVHAAGTLGVGAIFGDPTALSLKKFTSQKQAFDAGLSFGDRHIMLFGDYLHHFPGRIRVNNAFFDSLVPYVGVGPILVLDTGGGKKHHHLIDDDDDDFALGARIPFGVEWRAKEIPLGVSLELVPGIVVIPHTEGFGQGGVAIRYYF